MKSIVEQIFAHADSQPDKPALQDGKITVSYGQLKSQILYAKKLLEQTVGLQQGDSVILAANKQLTFVPVYFACHLIGAVALPVAPDINNRRFHFIYQKVAPKLVVGFQPEDIPCCCMSLEEFACNTLDMLEQQAQFPDIELVADIIFTTGTTGEPKGVQLTHKNIAAAALNINTFIQNTRQDVEMLALPISHSFGLGRLRCALSNGQTVVILGSFANMKRFFRFMEEFRVTGFGMVPASWAMIRKLSGVRIAEYASQLHYIEIGSAPMPIEEKRLLIDLFPKTRICMHYGLTEASRSAFMEFHRDCDRLDTIGKASPNMDIKILDESGVAAAVGTEGEICVKGNAVTPGYYQMPELNSISFWNGYFRTGDWGILEPDGYLRLCSRKKELINVGGKKVSPMEVEQVLFGLDYIKDCACVAIDDPAGVLGEVVKAFIVTDEPDRICKEIINKEISRQLEDYKLPVEYACIDEIPKTASGKVQRLLLKK